MGRALGPALVWASLVCKVLGALLLEDRSGCWVAFAPEYHDAYYPVNTWRRWTAWGRVLMAALEGASPLTKWKAKAALFVGHYRDAPRQRKKHTLSQIMDVTRLAPCA